MWATDYFAVIHGEIEAVGELTVTGALPYGTWMDDFGDDVNAAVASGNAIGFLTQAVTLVGPTFEQMSLGYQNQPALSGTKVTIAYLDVGDQIEVEDGIGNVYNSTIGSGTAGTSPGISQGLIVTSGPGTLQGCAALTEVSFKNGRLYAAQSGDTVHFHVINPQVVPVVDAIGNIRLRLRRIEGYKKG